MGEEEKPKEEEVQQSEGPVQVGTPPVPDISPEKESESSVADEPEEAEKEAT